MSSSTKPTKPTRSRDERDEHKRTLPQEPSGPVDLAELCAIAQRLGVTVWRVDDTGTLAPYRHPEPPPVVDWQRIARRL